MTTGKLCCRLAVVLLALMALLDRLCELICALAAADADDAGVVSALAASLNAL